MELLYERAFRELGKTARKELEGILATIDEEIHDPVKKACEKIIVTKLFLFKKVISKKWTEIEKNVESSSYVRVRSEEFEDLKDQYKFRGLLLRSLFKDPKPEDEEFIREFIEKEEQTLKKRLMELAKEFDVPYSILTRPITAGYRRYAVPKDNNEENKKKRKFIPNKPLDPVDPTEYEKAKQLIQGIK